MSNPKFVVVGVLAATVGAMRPQSGLPLLLSADLPPTCMYPSVCDHASPNDQPVAFRSHAWSVSSGSPGTSFSGVLPTAR